MMRNNLSFREFYKRRLPHIQIEGATYFITFRLADSLPVEALDKLAEDRHKINELPSTQKEAAHQAWFAKYDDYLDKALHGNLHLKNERIADLVADSIQFRDDVELERIVKYVLYNPVKAHLAKEQTDWKWSYCKCNM